MATAYIGRSRIASGQRRPYRSFLESPRMSRRWGALNHAWPADSLIGFASSLAAFGSSLAAGLDPARMKQLPELGRMSPGVWYFLPRGQPDPHHAHGMPAPTIAIAVNIE